MGSGHRVRETLKQTPRPLLSTVSNSLRAWRAVSRTTFFTFSSDEASSASLSSGDGRGPFSGHARR